jgi:hypothetical protein
MSIVIKELFPSDALSEALEKINFNFDQLILAGGGPPGPQGAQGAQGIAGPKGDRGDHWQVGSTGPTADHGPDFGQLLENDLWLGTGGTVYSYNPNTSTWVDTGTNLKGPKGDQGNTGSSVEFSLYAGITGISQQADSYGIDYNTVLTSDTTDVNFLVPLNTGKNSVFIGELDDTFNNFAAWNNISDFGTAGRQRAIPKLTTMQSWIDRIGLNGIQFGAKGSTSAEIVTLLNPWEVDDLNGNNSGNIDSKTFFNAAFYLKQPRNIISPNVAKTSTWTHGFRLGTFKMDLDIQAGLPTSNDKYNALIHPFVPSINISAYKLFIDDFDKTRTIHSYYKSTHGATSTYIDISARPQASNTITGPNTKGWVGLQTEQSTVPSGKEHGLGSVIIGTTANASFSIANEVTGLHIVRPITNHYDPNSASNGTDSHITLWSGSETSSTSFIAKFVGTRVSGFDSGLGYLQLQTRRFAITPKISSTPTLTNQYNPLFPFTVIQDYNSLPSLNDNFGSVMSEVNGVISGFQNSKSISSPAFGISIVNYTEGAIGIQAYSPNVSPGGFAGAQLTPHMYMQTGREIRYDSNGDPIDKKGNLGIGFHGESGTEAISKLSVNGSVAIGSTLSGYHNPARIKVPDGLLVQGTIVRGATTTAQAYSTDMLPMNAFLTGIRTGNIASVAGVIDPNGIPGLNDAIQNHIGLSINKKAMAESYIARSRQTIPTSGNVGFSLNSYNAVPSFSLMDLRTGMDSLGATAEGWLVVAPLKNQIYPNASGGYQFINNNSLRSVPTARFSNRTEYGGLTGAGFQVTSRFATSTRYMNAQEVENLVTLSSRHTIMYDSDGSYEPGIYGYEQLYISLPTSTSYLVLDLSDELSSSKRLAPTNRTYNFNQSPSPSNTINFQTEFANRQLNSLATTAPPIGDNQGFGLLRNRYISSLTWTEFDIVFQASETYPNYGRIFNNLLVTLDPGLYDGQEFTLTILGCLPEHELTMTPHPIYKNYLNSDVVSISSSNNAQGMSEVYPDRMILAREFPAPSNTGLPYPFPSSMSDAMNTPSNSRLLTNWDGYLINNTTQPLVSTSTAFNGGGAGGGINYPVGTNYIGDGRVVGISPSKGSFRFKPYRSIKLKWTRIKFGTGYNGVNGSSVSWPNETDDTLKWLQSGYYPFFFGGSSPYTPEEEAEIGHKTHWAWVEVGREYLSNSSKQSTASYEFGDAIQTTYNPGEFGTGF